MINIRDFTSVVRLFTENFRATSPVIKRLIPEIA
jgi:hypothetical protein